MSFEDLPKDWPTLPLTDPDHIARVLDLMVNLEARHIGALVILVCDEERRPLQPIQTDHIPASPPGDALKTFGQLAAAIGSRPGLSVVCAIARRHSLRVTANDLAWRNTLEVAFEGHAEVLGFHVITPDGSIPFRPLGEAA